MMLGVEQGQSAENKKSTQIPMEISHNRNNDQHFWTLAICQALF